MHTKRDIKPDDIKANIYDNVRFIVDMEGISTDGVEKSDIAIAKLFNRNLYNRIEDNYTYDEINEWDKREQRQILNRIKQRIIETEKVIRYISKDGNETIVISKYYIEIKLIYRKNYFLKDKIDLLQKIVDEFVHENPFIEIRNIFLVKDNAIVCKSIYMLYRCFDVKVFGNIKSGITYQKAVFTDYNSSASIVMDEYSLSINKGITAGRYKNDIAYMGKLDFAISYDGNKDIFKLDIKEVLTDMNVCLFDIFINNLTDSFANDLVNGTTTKVLEGFKKNE